jgi:BON domain
MRWLISVAVATSLLALLAADARAQFSNSGTSNRGTTTSGMFGSTTVGGSSALGSGANRGMTMATGTPAMGIGMGSTGMGGTGQGAAGISMGVPTMTQSNFVGASSQNTGNFRSLQGGQGGQGMQGTNGMQQGMNGMQGQNGMQGIGGRGATGISGLRNSLQGNRQNGFNAQQAQRSRQGGTQGQTQVRIPLRLGFQPTAIAAPRFNATFSDRLAKNSTLQRIGSINVALEGRTAILRGTVASEADRQLAAGLARLEPEVLVVQNELVVGSTETTEEALPPAPPAAAP